MTEKPEKINGCVTCLGIGCTGLIAIGIMVIAASWMFSTNDKDAVLNCTFNRLLSTENGCGTQPATGLVSLDEGLRESAKRKKCISNLKVRSCFGLRAAEGVLQGSLSKTTLSFRFDEKTDVVLCFTTGKASFLWLSRSMVMSIDEMTISDGGAPLHIQLGAEMNGADAASYLLVNDVLSCLYAKDDQTARRFMDELMHDRLAKLKQ